MRRLGLFLSIIAIVLSTTSLVLAQVEPEENDPDYWLNEWPHAVWCGKHEGPDLLSNIHGYVTEDGLGVILNPHRPEWAGDHWEGLVIKAGQVNTEHYHPEAGVRYDGNGQEVSHWIVCKGEGGATTTTQLTSTTIGTTTTASTTSSTAPTTTASSTTTATTVPSTSSTQPTTSTLPYTGIPVSEAMWYAGVSLVLGVWLVVLSARSRQR